MSLNECIDLKKKQLFKYLMCVWNLFVFIIIRAGVYIYLVGGHLWNLVPILNLEESYTCAKSYLN